MGVSSQLYLTPEKAICTCHQKIEISEHVKNVLWGSSSYVFFGQMLASGA